ncbi:hypothetical protein RIF23_13520 [Lipingzhangella sp. LS1_29]|uniref:LemA family protein n=1 Tax=Lipingzhangella rawalii TaxID=2055835 RepID=A0ABU2H7M8_9ACTN|nr:hypothetical protein [Lipingzhangella rawalii]MDS1271316.1 hypothetical protein [Lipingzhangella rawalii]
MSGNLADLVLTFSVVVVTALLVAFYVSWRASRLDRLHTRLETARAALEAAMARRHAAVVELAASAHLEPASRILLADAAGRALRADRDQEPEPAQGAEPLEQAESALSGTLRAVLEEPGVPEELRRVPGGQAALGELLAQARRLQLARRFHNDAVATIRQARHRWLVRVLRLAGHAPLPEYVEMDDQPPDLPDDWPRPPAATG